MSAHDPYAPKTTVGPHRVFPAPPPDPGTEVPGHPDELFAWLLEPRSDHEERARRVDLAEEVEMGRAGRVRTEVLDAISWHRAVITGDVDDDEEGPPDGWAGDGSTIAEGDGTPLDGVTIPDGVEATLTDDGHVIVHGTLTDDQRAEVLASLGPDADPELVVFEPEASATDEAEAPTYTDEDVPKNAADVIAWVRAAADEADAGARAVVAWRVEAARGPDAIRATVKAELDKHLE